MTYGQSETIGTATALYTAEEGQVFDLTVPDSLWLIKVVVGSLIHSN
jgi:hypothetical protein